MTTSTFFIIFIPLLSIILLFVNLLLAPHNPYQEKDSAFECGFHSFLGQNRTQFSVSFFIFAILFLLFDLEIILVYPYSVSGYSNDIYGLILMMVFFILLTLGFIFELGKNALTIDSKQTSSYNNHDTPRPFAFIFTSVTLLSSIPLIEPKDIKRTNNEIKSQIKAIVSQITRLHNIKAIFLKEIISSDDIKLWKDSFTTLGEEPNPVILYFIFYNHWEKNVDMQTLNKLINYLEGIIRNLTVRINYNCWALDNHNLPKSQIHLAIIMQTFLQISNMETLLLADLFFNEDTSKIISDMLKDISWLEEGVAHYSFENKELMDILSKIKNTIASIQ